MSNNSNLSKLSDEELLLEHRESGKRSCVRELFNRYLQFIYGVCLNCLKDADEADEAVMQIYNELLYKLSDYEITDFRSWIYRFTKNHCLQTEGQENDAVPADSDDQAAKSGKILDFLESIDDNQSSLLANWLKELPEQQRISINYFFRDKLSYAEIADKVGYTLKHVKSYIQRGKQNLQICLEKSGE